MSVIVRALTKTFGAKAESAAASAVSFEAPSGKVTALLGPSGSGKSTVLRLIAGLEEPDQGQISIDGKDVTLVSARERGVGFVFQSYALFGHMTVHDNIGFGLKIRGASKGTITRRVNDLLRLIQLEGYEGRLPLQLSGGQRQRVALARALATEPKVLLLDEPFGALDAQVRRELREWLVEFHDKTGVTTILVTHDQEEALEVSEYVVLLSGGRVVQSGTPHDLYDTPATPFVASFLGASNILSAKLTNGHGKVALPQARVDRADVQALIRPSDVRIVKATEARSDAPLASVERVTRVGSQVKVTLALPDGESITVQLSKWELDAIDIKLGDRVFLDLEGAKVFVGGQAT